MSIEGALYNLISPPRISFPNYAPVAKTILKHFSQFENSFTSVDDVTIRFTVYKNLSATANQKTLVIYTHTHGGCGAEGLPLLDNCFETGASLCLYDSRGCGASDQAHLTFGDKESIDLLYVLFYCGIVDGFTEFVLWGRSIGTCTVIQLAAKLALEQMQRSGAAPDTDTRAWLDHFKPLHLGEEMARFMDLNGLVYAHEFRFSIEGLVLDSPLKSLSSSIENFVCQNIANFDFLGRMASGYVQKWIRDKIGVDITEGQNINLVRKISTFGVFICSKNDETVLYSDSFELFRAFGSFTNSDAKKLVHIECKHKEKRPPLQTGQALKLLLNDPGRKKRRFLFKLAADRPTGINLSIYESRRSEVSTQESSRFWFGSDGVQPGHGLANVNNVYMPSQGMGKPPGSQMPSSHAPSQPSNFARMSGSKQTMETPPQSQNRVDPSVIQTMPARTSNSNQNPNPLMAKYQQPSSALTGSQSKDYLMRMPTTPAPQSSQPPGTPALDMFKKHSGLPPLLAANPLHFDKKREPTFEEVKTDRDKPGPGLTSGGPESFLSDANGQGSNHRPEGVYPHTVHKARDHSSNVQRHPQPAPPRNPGRFSEMQSVHPIQPNHLNFMNHQSATRLPPTRPDNERRPPSAIPVREPNTPSNRHNPPTFMMASAGAPMPPQALERAPTFPQPNSAMAAMSNHNSRPPSQSEKNLYGPKPTQNPTLNLFSEHPDQMFSDPPPRANPNLPPTTPRGPPTFINAYQNYMNQSRANAPVGHMAYSGSKPPEASGMPPRPPQMPPPKPTTDSRNVSVNTPRGQNPKPYFPATAGQQPSTQNQVAAMQNIQQLQARMMEHQNQSREVEAPRVNNSYGGAYVPTRVGDKAMQTNSSNPMPRYRTQSFNGIDSDIFKRA